MGKKITFSCNLCHTSYEDRSKIKAYYWGIIEKESPKQGYQINDRIDDCGTHICIYCINVLTKQLTS